MNKNKKNILLIKKINLLVRFIYRGRERDFDSLINSFESEIKKKVRGGCYKFNIREDNFLEVYNEVLLVLWKKLYENFDLEEGLKKGVEGCLNCFYRYIGSIVFNCCRSFKRRNFKFIDDNKFCFYDDESNNYEVVDENFGIIKCRLFEENLRKFREGIKGKKRINFDIFVDCKYYKIPKEEICKKYNINENILRLRICRFKKELNIRIRENRIFREVA